MAQEFQNSIETMKQEYLSLQSNIQQYETTVQEAERRHEEEREALLVENRQLSEQREELLRQLGELSGQFNEYKSVQDQLREHLQSTFQIERKALENEKQILIEKLQGFERRFSKEREENEENRKKIEELRKNLKALKENKEEIDSSRAEAQQALKFELESQKKINLDFQRDLIRVDSMKFQYESQIKQLKDIINNNKQDHEKLYKLIDLRKEEYEKLEETNKNLLLLAYVIVEQHREEIETKHDDEMKRKMKSTSRGTKNHEPDDDE